MTPPEPSADDTDVLPFSDLATLAPARPMAVESSQPWSQRVWGLLTQLIPPALLALAAAGTWWLVRQSPMPTATIVAPGAASLPDFKMQRFSMQQYDAQGRARARIDGDELLHFPDRREVEIAQVRMHWNDDAGVAHVAKARQARSDDDTNRVTLRGEVTVTREDPVSPAHFYGESILVLTQESRVESNEPVRLVQGNAELRGKSLRYDHARGLAELGGGVRGTMVAGAP